MPPKKVFEEKTPEQVVEEFIESPQEKLENRIAVLENLMGKLWCHHFGPLPKE